MLWVKQDSPYKTAGDYLKAAASGDFKMGGAQSKDTDEVQKAGHVKLTYIPFKSGAEAAVQLAGGHIDSHVNNPSESLGQWRGGTQRPLCAFSPNGFLQARRSRRPKAGAMSRPVSSRDLISLNTSSPAQCGCRARSLPIRRPSMSIS